MEHPLTLQSRPSKSVTAIVADECPGCSTADSLDLSTGAFDAIGDEDTGVLSISWYFSVSLFS